MESCTVFLEGYTYDLSGLRSATGAQAPASASSPDYDYWLNPCQAIESLPTGCAGATADCAPPGCSVWQHTADGLFCYAAGDAGSLSASWLDPSSGQVGSPSDGLTLSWGSPLSTCGSAGNYRRSEARLICSGSSGDPGRGIELPPAGSCHYQMFWDHPAPPPR